MNQIKIGALISYVAIALDIVIGLLYTPWMINTIGKADYGLYTLAMSVVSLFVFDFGLGNAVTRFASKYLAEGRQDKVDNLLGLVFKLYGLGDLIILLSLVVIYFFLSSIYQGLTPEEMDRFKVVYIIASLFSVISFPFIPLNGIITSYEKFIQLKSCGLANKLIIVIAMSICLIMGAGLYALVIVNSIAGILIIILKLAILGKVKIRSINWRFWDKNLLKSVLGFSIWVTIIQLAQRCIFNISPSILAVYESSSAITILGIAICFETYTYGFASAINSMLLPKVSRMVASKDKSSILSLMTRVGRIQIYIIGLICVGFICVGKDFIQVWLGDGNDELYICTLFLMLPSFFHIPQEVGTSAIIAEGEVKLQSFAVMAMAIVNICLAFPLSKYYGVVGICFSIMISYFVRTILFDVIFYRRLNLNIFKFFKESYLRIFPSLLLSVLLSIAVCQVLPFGGWVGFVTKSACCIILYSISVWYFAMNQDEHDLILTPIRKIIRRG